MDVVVTGGAGFIGANLVRTLIDERVAARVRVLDDLSTGRRENLAGIAGVDLTVGSVLEPGLLDDVFAGADAVVHLAARPSVPRSLEDPLATHHSNATGTLQVLEAARRAGAIHTIVASSSAVYGDTPVLPKAETAATRPLSPYAVSKLATEGYATAYASSFGLPTLSFRFFNVFGPLQPADHAYAAVIPAFIAAAMDGRPLPVEGDGGQTRDFTYVGTVTRVIADAVRRGVTHATPVNLAFGSRRSLLEVVAELEELLGYGLEVDHRPPRSGDVRHSQADGRLLAELFPDVGPAPFRAGLEDTVRWFRHRRDDAVAQPDGPSVRARAGAPVTT